MLHILPAFTIEPAARSSYNVGMFPFDRPNNYDEMLNKIGAFTFLEALLLTCLIGYFVPPVGGLLGSFKIPIDVYSIKIPLLYVVPSVLIGLIARIIRLHDKLSDLFQIRKTFDVYRVLTPLAGAVGYAINPALLKMLKDNREKAMQRTFYKYASFEEPKISKALVLSAIDLWTWYWILAEFLFLLTVSAVIFLLFGAYAPAAYTLVAICTFVILFCTVFGVCGNEVDHQIEEIVSDSDRVAELKHEFESLLKTNV
jgi:uncharacterized membrane protein